MSRGVTSIGEGAFNFCRKAGTFEIPNTVKTIGKGPSDFARSGKIQHSDSVTTIGAEAFSYNEGCRKLTIGKNVTSIGAEAFMMCRQIKASLLKEMPLFWVGMLFVDWHPCIHSITNGRWEPCQSLRQSQRNWLWHHILWLPVVREDSITTASKGNTSDGPIMDAVVFFDVNLNGLPDEGEPQTTSNGRGDYWLDIPLETYDLNGNGVIDISEGVIVSQGGTDTATGLSMKTVLKGPANATVITPLTTLVTRVMEQNPELGASAAAGKLEASLGIPDGVDILNFDTFKEARNENPSAADVLTATAKLQDTLVQGGNLIGGATGKSLQAGSDAVMDAIAQQVEADDAVDLDSKDSLKSLITEAAGKSGANLTEAQTDGAASIMQASSKAKEDARAAASTVTELAAEVSRVQAVSQSKAAENLEAVGAQTADLESTVLAYTGAAMQQQVQTESWVISMQVGMRPQYSIFSPQATRSTKMGSNSRSSRSIAPAIVLKQLNS